MAGLLSKFFRHLKAARGRHMQRGNDPTQPLPDEVTGDMERGRAWVKGCFQAEAQPQFDTVAGSLAMLQLLLSSGGVKPDERMKQECLGILFGDAVAKHTGMIWMMHSDQFGSEPALNFPGTSVCIFPLSMISKRMTAGEAFDFSELFNAICAEVERIRRLPNLT